VKKRELVALLVLCLASAVAGFGAFVWWQQQLAAERAEVRPDLEFRDLDLAPHRLSEWSGKLLLLNFWATWCTPCLKEIPLLVETQQLFGARGLQIVGIAMDEVAPVRAFQARLNMNYPLMVGEADVISAMDELGDPLGAFPFSVLIAPDGRIVARVSGALTREELRSWMDEHLPKGL
jgi:thiol-disulfide isomerase/thioredoxin